MQQFANIVEQLNEAVRFISDGSIAHARMALLLLDNTAELLLARVARGELARDAENAKHYERAMERDPNQAAELLGGRRLLSKKARREIEFNFDAKAEYLVELEELDRGMADVLKALHRHRNDTYHKDRLRAPIIRATAILYLELCCDLLVRFGIGGSYSMSNEWDDFRARYGLGQSFFFEGEKVLEKLAARFRAAVGIHGHELASTLANYFRTRLEALEEELDFLDYYRDHDEALHGVQFGATHGDDFYQRISAQGGPKFFEALEAAKAKFVPAVTTETLRQWREAADNLSSATSAKADLFTEYHRLELALEPIEEMVAEEAAAYSHHIDMEVEHRRLGEP